MFADWKQGFVPAERTSAAIRMIRPLLVLFITFAHFRLVDDYSRIVNASALDFDGWLAVFLKAGLAKSGVPLLSLISGYLAVVSLERYGYGKVLLRKARRLVWPLFWANLLFIVLITWPEQARDPGVRPDLAIHPFNVMGWFQATFAFYKLPANEPLYFLKDLFTCFLLLPLLLVAARIRYFNLLVVVWMAYKCIYLQSAFFFEVYPLWFMRFDIVFAFYIGILLHTWRRELVIVRTGFNVGLVALYLGATAAAAAIYVVLAKPDHVTFFLWADFLVKVCSVLGCIAIMSLLAVHRGRLAGLFAWLSPYAYTLFLTHLFTFTFFRKLWLQWYAPPEFFAVSGVIYLLAMVAAAVGVSIALARAWWAVRRALPGRA